MQDARTDTDCSPPPLTNHPPTRDYSYVAAPSAIETNDPKADFVTVTKWPRRKMIATAPTHPIPARKPKKVPAILVCLREGSSYVDTVTAVKVTINPASLGAKSERLSTNMPLIEFNNPPP